MTTKNAGNTPATPAGVRLHHTSARRGYVSRRETPAFSPYKGKFGEGFTRTLPRWDTTRYVWLEYWVK